jgi:hypothetical protein
MKHLVYGRPAYKKRVAITRELRAAILAGLVTTSQKQLARKLGVSQTAISRIARSVTASLPSSATK